MQGGFCFHPSDEDLWLGTPVGKGHSSALASLCSNWRTAIASVGMGNIEQREVGAGDSSGAFGMALAADRRADASRPRDGARELAVDRTAAALPA
jgi:hypothetical protein